ncbi:MAG: PQQ-binding-like beta-propeller repeat protein [Candidatus Brocadiia bacterium]
MKALLPETAAGSTGRKGNPVIIRFSPGLCIVVMCLFLVICAASSPGEEGRSTTIRTPLSNEAIAWLFNRMVIDYPNGDGFLGLKSNGTSFLLASETRIACLDAAGALKWTIDFGDGEHNGMGAWTVSEDSCMLICSAKNVELRCLSIADGSTKWTLPLAEYIGAAIPVRGGSMLAIEDRKSWLVINTKGERVYAAGACPVEGLLQASAGDLVFGTAMRADPDTIYVPDSAWVSVSVGNLDGTGSRRLGHLSFGDPSKILGGTYGLGASEVFAAHSYGSATLICAVSGARDQWTEEFVFSSAAILGSLLVCADKSVRFYDCKSRKTVKEITGAKECRVIEYDSERCVYIRQGKAVGFVGPDYPGGIEIPETDVVFGATIADDKLVYITDCALVRAEMKKGKKKE